MIRVGVDYYPEHWDEHMWIEDVRLMQESGVNVVRMAEFAWSRLEPVEGHFDFMWLDNVVELFAHHDISVVLGIPTMTPPHWLTQHYPDVLPDLPGQHLSNPGVRGHRCYNSPSMRKYTQIIVEQMADRYGQNEAIIGWQTDNEFSLQMCRCSFCTEAFRLWLKDKYGTLEEVNKEWGTVVWSGEFTDWEQVQLYATDEQYFNPSFLLDYRRFQSESVTTFQQIQVDVIREKCPRQFITHNTWSAPLPLDHEALYKPLDFASFDYYPATSPHKALGNPYSGALLLDRTRGFKGRNFWVMEQFGGMPGSWMPTWRSPHPGFLRAFAWQSIARGADGVVFFRWRSAAAGAEQFWHGLIDHSNVPGRRFEEFRQFCGEVNALSDRIYGTVLHNQVAILYDFDSHTALQLQPQVEGHDYYEHIKVMHRALVKQGIGVDIIHSLQQNMKTYRMLIIPSLFVLSQETAQQINDYITEGGVVIATPRTGVKQPNNQCYMEPLPGPLSETFGVRVVEYDPIGEDTHKFTANHNTVNECIHWNDLLEVTTAEVIARYASDFYKDMPAITRNIRGKGSAYYMGTFPEERYYQDLFMTIAKDLGIEYVEDLPEGVQITHRSTKVKTYTFLLNLSREERKVNLNKPMKRLLKCGSAEERFILSAYEVEILEPLES